MGVKEKLEAILYSGWGVKVAIGMLIGHLDPITLEQTLEYISSNHDLFDNLSEEEWEHYRKMAEGTRLTEIDTARVHAELNKRRNDLFQLISNTSGGIEWLDNQVTRLRRKLGLLTK